MARKVGKALSVTVTKEVEVDVDVDVTFSFNEIVEFLEGEGWEVIPSNTGGELTRDTAKKMLERIREEFGGTLAETDYWHGSDIKIPPGATVLIIPSL